MSQRTRQLAVAQKLIQDKVGIEDAIQNYESVLRLQKELFPQGKWKFPAQTLAIPTALADREVTEQTNFTDKNSREQTPWIPCGPGETLPTRITQWRIERQGRKTRRGSASKISFPV